VFFLIGWLEKKNRKEKSEAPKSNFKVLYPKPDPYFGFFEKREKKMQTRGEAAEARYAGQTYDHALPDGWVDACKERGLDPVGHFVWLYDDWVGRPAPITDEGERILSLLARLP
jgi:hypothetical protein